MTRTVPLLGLGFAAMDLDRVVDRLLDRPADAPFGYVVTPNADHFVRLAADPALAAIYQDAMLRLLDSRVVAGLARLAGLDAPPVVPGSDLVAALLPHLAGERITIIGLSPALLPALVARYRLAPPAHHDPPADFDRDPAAFAAAVRFVRANPARFTILAVGSPRQEHLAAAIAADPGMPGVGLCVGASLEFLAGARPRAPLWMRQVRLEWLHRLLSDPRRLARRYLLDSPGIIPLLLRERRRAG
ncbi:MAG: WecB/TagA/CpsF family glycosyltransferase [Acetobacteraceae bacterium]